MTIDQSQPKTLSFFWLKPSHRTGPEQVMGAVIFFLFSLIFQWLFSWFIHTACQTEWVHQTFSSHWALSLATSRALWTVNHMLIAFAMWNLWRRNSLTILKLELAVFFAQFFLQTGWSLSLFFLQEVLLALLALVFICSNMMLSALLFWKKERFSGQILIPSCLWIFYMMGVNMAICLSHP